MSSSIYTTNAGRIPSGKVPPHCGLILWSMLVGEVALKNYCEAQVVVVTCSGAHFLALADHYGLRG